MVKIYVPEFVFQFIIYLRLFAVKPVKQSLNFYTESILELSICVGMGLTFL